MDNGLSAETIPASVKIAKSNTAIRFMRFSVCFFDLGSDRAVSLFCVTPLLQSIQLLLTRDSANPRRAMRFLFNNASLPVRRRSRRMGSNRLGGGSRDGLLR